MPPGAIPAEERLEPGRVLCVYGDGGWGHLVREARLAGRAASSELFDAAAATIDRWRPSPSPDWIAFVPSRSSSLTTDLAEALGSALGIPVWDVLQRTADRPPQSHMDNSAQQLTNVHGAFVVHGDVPPGPVLLVDDTVTSRWTLTAVGALLRRAGSGPVLPFALAQARG